VFAVDAAIPRILIVDDDPLVNEALAAALADRYVVHTATTGAEARALLDRQPVSAIILDVVLGGEQGMSLIEPFRMLTGAPILILTGHSSEDLAIRALRARVNDYLRKPVAVKDIRASLARAIHEYEERPAPVECARQYLARHLDGAHTTASLAREVGLSERHLHRQFLEAYGMTPRRYLIRLRLERAAELLRTTPLGVEKIARQVGCPSLVTFVRQFRRAFGHAPSEWRARHACLAGVNGSAERGDGSESAKFA
jgi:YesN/AraC family two-component response regulator